MANMTQTRLEGLVDLFLSPHFRPVHHEAQPSASGSMEFEAEIKEDEETEIEALGHQLAQMGDEFFTSYASDATQPQANNSFNLSVIDDKLKTIFINLANIEERSAGALQEEQEKAWSTYKSIIRTSISDVCGSDVKRMLGAFLVCLNGLSHLEAPAKKWARDFSLRFMQTEVSSQNAEGLNEVLNNNADDLD